MKTGRNDPCPCGSGKKFKNCHAEKNPEKIASDRIGWIVVAVVAVGAISLFATLRPDSKPKSSPGSTQAPLTAPAPAPAVATEPPSGEPPPGKVWSTEHGHWHDAADPSQVQFSTSTPAQASPAGLPPGATPGAQPPGPAPEGKVWSTEHGHWHDAPGATPADPVVPAELQPYMQPPGVPETPEGMVWSEEHKHWHDAKKDAERKAAAPQQPAPAPKP